MQRVLQGSFCVVMVVVAAVAMLPNGGHAWCQLTTLGGGPAGGGGCMDEGVPLAWRRPCLTYAVERSALSTEEAQLLVSAARRAVATWMAVECNDGGAAFQLMELEEPSMCRESQFNQGAGNVNTIAVIDDWAERGYDGRAFALTTTWHDISTGDILDADMQLNGLRRPYGVCPDAGCAPLGGDGTTADMENIVTHEFGHFLGLAHSGVPESTMLFASPRGEVIKRDLHPDDVEGLCSIYPLGALTEACDFTPEGGLRLECACRSDVDACGAECVDLGSNPNHCGECDRVCPGGQRCASGECVAGCGSELSACGRGCVDLMSNPLHCGRCDRICPQGRDCVDGECLASGGCCAVAPHTGRPSSPAIGMAVMFLLGFGARRHLRRRA